MDILQNQQQHMYMDTFKEQDQVGKGQGPSIDVNGNVVPWNSRGAHWPLN